MWLIFTSLILIRRNLPNYRTRNFTIEKYSLRILLNDLMLWLHSFVWMKNYNEKVLLALDNIVFSCSNFLSVYFWMEVTYRVQIVNFQWQFFNQWAKVTINVVVVIYKHLFWISLSRVFFLLLRLQFFSLGRSNQLY